MRDDEISSKSDQITELLRLNEDSARAKVAAEMRALEAEENRDRIADDNAELKRKSEALSLALEANSNPNSQLEERLNESDVEKRALESALAEFKRNYRLQEKELIDTSEELKRKTMEMAEVEKLLLAKNAEIADGIEIIRREERNSAEEKDKSAKFEEEIHRLNGLNEELRNSVEDSALRSLRAELEALKDESESEKVKSKEKDEFISELQRNFAGAKSEFDALKGELNEERDQRDQLERDIEEVQNEFEALNKGKVKLLYLRRNVKYVVLILRELQIQSRGLKAISHGP